MARLSKLSSGTDTIVKYPDITFDGEVNAFGNLAICKYFLNVTNPPPYLTE